MKKIIVSVLLCSVLALPFSVNCSASWGDKEPLSKGLEVISASSGMVVSGRTSNTLTFTDDMFRECYLREGDYSVTVVGIPSPEEGVLSVGNVPVGMGQEIKSSSLSSLKFTPSEGCVSSSFNFTFDGMYTAQCMIRFTDKVNFAPSVDKSVSAWTCSDIQYSGQLYASDPEGDNIIFEVVSSPMFGILQLSKNGSYMYTPFESACGVDSFTYRARDEFGNYSVVSTVSVEVEESSSELVFSDMDVSPCYAAAISVVSDGIMSVSENGNGYCFNPDDTVTEADFLVSVMDAFGADNIPSSVDGVDSSVPSEAKGYVKAATALGIIDSEMNFSADTPITYEKASVILNRIVGLKCDEQTPILENTSDYARNDVSALCEAGITDSHEDFTSKLTRAKCAGIICSAVRFFD